MAFRKSPFDFILSNDIDVDVKLKIKELHGREVIDELAQKASPGYNSVTSSTEAELLLTCSIYSNGTRIGMPISSYKTFSDPYDLKWNEWFTFPVKYKDLPLDACFVITIWDLSSDPNLLMNDDPLQNLIKSFENKDGENLSLSKPQPLGGTTFPIFNKKKLMKLRPRKLFLWKKQQGDPSPMNTTPYKAWKTQGVGKLDKIIPDSYPTVKWLDVISNHRIQSGKLFERFSTLEKNNNRILGMADSEMIRELKEGANMNSDLENLPSPPFMFLSVDFYPFPTPVVFYSPPSVFKFKIPQISPFSESKRLFVVFDSDPNLNNPVESKYYKLARKGVENERRLKPNLDERKRLQAVITSANKHLTGTEKELLWRFRYALTEDNRALTKFLRAVNWDTDLLEVKEALDLLNEWAPVEIADALELLSSDFTNEEVRKYAVKQLGRADKEEIFSFLLQLVQALRFEKHYPSHLSEFLISQAAKDFDLANFFYWFLMVERQDSNPAKSQMFANIHTDFVARLKEKSNTSQWEDQLHAQGSLLERLLSLSEEIINEKGRVEKKIEKMKSLLSPDGDYKDIRQLSKPISCWLRPEVQLVGLDADMSSVFKSAKLPMLLAFKTKNPKTDEEGIYKVIFKSGDDLRQDQLVLQLIGLIDFLLKKVKLDLKLTPYRVLATSPFDGFMEFIKSQTLSSILETEKNISIHIEGLSRKPQDLQRNLDTFIKSTAGYCVITYILGIGDRHLDNILLTPNGHLFHVDFGYIFGKDPKPFPPPMKFSKEMVDAMGGQDSSHYQDFRKYCCLAFNILRKHANLILNLLALMGESNIPDLCNDLEKNMLKVQEKFRLDLSDEEAEAYLLQLIDESERALFPVIVDKLHKFAQYWR